MKNITNLLWIIATTCLLSAELLLLSTAAQASNNQFYFTAKSAALGASSEMGKSGNAVYLRWDLVEGEIPDDITRFELKRDGNVILQKNINDLMPQSYIREMYAGASEQQRLLQTISLLKKLSLAQDETFEANDFAAELHKRFNNVDDKAWVFLASRQNFNIARAQYRAFLDTEASGSHTYTLHAFNAQGNSGQLGKVTIDTSEKDHIIPAPANFHQIEKDNCGIVNAMQDHYAVLLDWAPPSTSITDKTASSLQRAGYQIYRSKTNIGSELTEASVRDFATEALDLPHDQRGYVSFEGLERVNSSIVVVEGHTTSSIENPAFFESHEQLAAAGLEPGDKRAYYIVPVDFAGHLGETAGAIVQVPDRQMPATPWNIQFHQSTGTSARASLEWDASTLENYTAYYSNSRVICNAEEAATSHKIEYADNIEACGNPLTTRVDISSYLVYRFETAQQANRFADSDGDGYTDVDERTNDTNACDDDSKPSSTELTNYLVESEGFSRIDLDDHRSRIRFNDSELVDEDNIGKAFWYRVASITSDGNISPLSAPIQGLFWDRTLPPKPTFTALATGCCELTNQGAGNWGFTDNIEQLGSLSLAFRNRSSSLTEAINWSDFANSDSDICSAKNSPIAAFLGANIADRQLIYPGTTPGTDEQAYCKVSIPEEMDLCSSGSWQLSKKTCDQPVSDGDIVDNPVQITITAQEEDNCLVVFREIAGQYTRVASSCGTENPGTIEYLAEPGSCGFTQAIDPSGNISPMEQLPCTTAASVTPPSPPQIISFIAGQEATNFSWRLPLEPVAVTLIEISSDIDESVAEASDQQFVSVPNAGFNPGKLFNDSTEIHALIGLRDQWCIRMKSIAPGTQDAEQVLSSDWSNRLCSTRRLGSDLSTDYLPWPKVKTVAVQKNLGVHAAKDYVDTGSSEGMAYEKMAMVIIFGGTLPITTDIECQIQSKSGNYHEENAQDIGSLLFGRHAECYSLSSVLKLQQIKHFELPFIAYRQGRTPLGEVGPWVQVSPLIDNIHWEFVNGAKGPSWLLDDPYFKFFRQGYDATNSWNLSYVDRYPHIAGYDYRYQIVTFNDEHAISEIHLSAGEDDTWVKAADLGAIQ